MYTIWFKFPPERGAHKRSATVMHVNVPDLNEARSVWTVLAKSFHMVSSKP